MFTQKISMDCTQRQYEEYLRDELLKMGYKEIDIYIGWTCGCVIINNYSDRNGEISSVGKKNKNSNSRLYLGSFNPELFLAYAAMTDKKFGGYGEWWMCVRDGIGIKSGKIYKAVKVSDNDTPWFEFDYGGENGVRTHIFFDHFRKATTDEINERFGKKAVDTEQIPNTENETERCIAYLKDKGYKILRKVENWEEV